MLDAAPWNKVFGAIIIRKLQQLNATIEQQQQAATACFEQKTASTCVEENRSSVLGITPCVDGHVTSRQLGSLSVQATRDKRSERCDKLVHAFVVCTSPACSLKSTLHTHSSLSSPSPMQQLGVWVVLTLLNGSVSCPQTCHALNKALRHALHWYSCSETNLWCSDNGLHELQELNFGML